MKNLVFICAFLLVNMFVPLVYATQVALDLEDDKVARNLGVEPQEIESIFQEDETNYQAIEDVIDEHNMVLAKQSRGGEESKLFDCNEAKFASLIKDAITKYQDANPQITSLGKRKHKLLIREFENFTEIPTDNITSKYSNLLAGEVIKLKINQKISAADMRVCQAGKGPEGGNIFILMYQDKNYINVRILNVAYAGDIEALTFKY